MPFLLDFFSSPSCLARFITSFKYENCSLEVIFYFSLFKGKQTLPNNLDWFNTLWIVHFSQMLMNNSAKPNTICWWYLVLFTLANE